MAELTTIQKVKLALRINHIKLDSDIQATIDTAKKEMERAGILQAMIIETDALVLEAIKVYCKYSFASNDKMREGYFISWQYQLDCLRKSTSYSVEVVVV